MQDVQKMNYADSTILKRELTVWFNVHEEMKLVVCLIKLNTCQPGTVSADVKPPSTPHPLPERKQIYRSLQVLSTHSNALPNPHWRYKIDNLPFSPLSFTSLLSVYYVLSLLADGYTSRQWTTFGDEATVWRLNLVGTWERFSCTWDDHFPTSIYFVRRGGMIWNSFQQKLKSLAFQPELKSSAHIAKQWEHF
jgi:hypothetical protein